MAVSWFSLDVDARDPAELARWWARALDYKVMWEEDAYVAIAKDDRTFPGLIFNRVAGAKTEEEPPPLGPQSDGYRRRGRPADRTRGYEGRHRAG